MIKVYESHEEAKRQAKAKKMHVEEYEKAFEIAWSKIVIEKVMGEDVADIAVRVICSHAANYIYLSLDTEVAGNYIRAYENMLISSGRMDEFETFKDSFLDIASKLSEALYQTYIESKCFEPEDVANALNEIHKFYKKMPLSVVNEITAVCEFLREKS